MEDGEKHAQQERGGADARPVGGSGEQDMQLFGDEDVTPSEEAREEGTSDPPAAGNSGVGDGEVGSGEFIFFSAKRGA